MSRLLKLHYLPLALCFAAILAARMSGNDKAPFLVMAAGGASFILGILYFVTLSPIKAVISIAPGLGLALLVGLSKLGLIDLMPILGFR